MANHVKILLEDIDKLELAKMQTSMGGIVRGGGGGGGESSYLVVNADELAKRLDHLVSEIDQFRARVLRSYDRRIDEAEH